jgi:hypothetical protein
VNISLLPTNLTLIVLLNTLNSGGHEYVEIDPPGLNNPEKFQSYGNFSVKRKYKITPMFEDDVHGRLEVLFIRKNLHRKNLAIWQKKIMTGVEFEWYFEDENGEKVEVKPDDKYNTQQVQSKPNILFRKWMNIIFYAINFKAMPLEDAFKILKYTKGEWLYNETLREKPGKGMLDGMIDDQTMEQFISTLGYRMKIN